MNQPPDLVAAIRADEAAFDSIELKLPKVPSLPLHPLDTLAYPIPVYYNYKLLYTSVLPFCFEPNTQQ